MEYDCVNRDGRTASLHLQSTYAWAVASECGVRRPGGGQQFQNFDIGELPSGTGGLTCKGNTIAWCSCRIKLAPHRIRRRRHLCAVSRV